MKEIAKDWLWWAVPIVVAAGVGGALYYGRTHKAQDPEPAQHQAPAVAAEAKPGIQNPLEQAADPAKPLPTLNESDAELHDSLSAVFGRSLDKYLVPQNVVRNIVVTIDNLPRKKTNVQRWPVKATGGEFAIRGADEITLDPDNYSRYAPLVKLVQTSDATQIAETYRRLYPLFQQAYIDLGYPDGYFNDRLVEVIDHLLETPEPTGPVLLTQPGVFYEFADPALESRSSGQKVLLRMGNENAAAVKEKLRELRREVAKQTKPN